MGDEVTGMFATALRAILATRGVPPTGPAVAARLAKSRRYVHPHTVREILAGKRAPKMSTVELILQGLDATDAERELLTNALSGAVTQTTPGVVRVLDALGGVDAVDRGREVEHVVWRYFIGAADTHDRCAEVRRTRLGPSGLRLASFGPGEFRRPGFDLLDIPTLDVQVVAHQICPGGAPEVVPTAVHVVEVEPVASNYRMVVQFGEMTGATHLEWVASYRWPGLWRSLRAHGTAVGRLGFRGNAPKVTSAAVELVASGELFPDLRLEPLSPVGKLTRATKAGIVRLTWTVPRPLGELRFEVHSPGRETPDAL